MLVKLIKNEVTIDHELINLSDTKNYYINRTFKLPCLKETIFKDEKSDDLLAISGIDKISLNKLVQEANKICLYEEVSKNSNRINNVSFIILDNEQADDQFEQLCRPDQQHNIHWLKFEQDNLIWKRSHGSISKLHEYIKDETNYAKQYLENELLNQTSQQKVIIISDTSGMGKSTVLTHLALQIKEHDPALWLIRINLNEHTDQLEEQKKMVLQHKLSMKTIEEFLAKDVLKLATPFEKALFEYYCQHSHDKLIIMFDGFDEICPDYRDIVIDLMLALRNSTIKQLWVTSRPTEELILEKKLQNISYKLEPFSEQNQINFLTEFWKQTLNTVTVDEEKFKVYANALIKLLSESTSDKDKEFTGIPLQIRMLAEAFDKDFKTFYNSSTDEPQLPTKLDLNDLYERFFEKKYNIYQKEKNKLDLSKPGVKILSGESYAQFIGKHQNLALCTLFKKHNLEILLSEKAYQEFSKNHPIVLAKSCLNIENLKESLMNESEQKIKSFINDIKTNTVNNGIIDQIIEDKPRFIHRTFAEYLVGKFLVDSLDNETVVEFVLQEILMQPAYQVTRAFFNSQLPETLPEDTLARYGKQIEGLWQSDKNTFCNKKGMTLLHLAAEEGTVKIIKFFLNSLKEHEEILKSLVEATTTIHYYKNPTALHLAAAGGYLDVVQCLVKHGADVNIKSDYNETVLHYAVQGNKLDVVQWLVEHEKANVEDTDKYGMTVLHYAVQGNKLDVVQWVVEHGKANVEATDKYGMTVLHWAAQENELDVVQWLVEHGKANVEATDNDGKTPLNLAKERKRKKITEYLKKR